MLRLICFLSLVVCCSAVILLAQDYDQITFEECDPMSCHNETVAGPSDPGSTAAQIYGSCSTHPTPWIWWQAAIEAPEGCSAVDTLAVEMDVGDAYPNNNDWLDGYGYCRGDSCRYDFWGSYFCDGTSSGDDAGVPLC